VTVSVCGYVFVCLCLCLFCCVSVVVSVVCMYSYVTGGYVCGMVHQIFGSVFVWSVDMFRRWYYVVCMGCLYWVRCWFECNYVRVSGVVVCDTDSYMYGIDVCQCCDNVYVYV